MRLVGCKYILYEACFILCSVLLVTEVCGSDHPQPQQAAAAAKSTAAPVRTIVGLPPAIEEPEPSTSMSTETPVFTAVTSPHQPKDKNACGASFYRTIGTKTRQLQTSA